MRAYLQNSESTGEEELTVQFPDPPDGTVVIPLHLGQIGRALDALWTSTHGTGEMWVRVVFDTWEEAIKHGL